MWNYEGPAYEAGSHSIRVSGLKLRAKCYMEELQDVSLYTSEWIEICQPVLRSHRQDVSLYTSEWIEIIKITDLVPLMNVSLYTSEWIEIFPLVSTAET